MIECFRELGWRDEGSIIAIVEAVDSTGSITPSLAAQVVTPAFLSTNGATRQAVTGALRDWAYRTS